MTTQRSERCWRAKHRACDTRRTVVTSFRCLSLNRNSTRREHDLTDHMSWSTMLTDGTVRSGASESHETGQGVPIGASQ